MNTEKAPAQRISIEQHSATGMLWLAMWLFTIGFLDLGWGRGILAIILWPYYLGRALAPLLPGGS